MYLIAIIIGIIVVAIVVSYYRRQHNYHNAKQKIDKILNRQMVWTYVYIISEINNNSSKTINYNHLSSNVIELCNTLRQEYPDNYEIDELQSLMLRNVAIISNLCMSVRDNRDFFRRGTLRNPADVGITEGNTESYYLLLSNSTEAIANKLASITSLDANIVYELLQQFNETVYKLAVTYNEGKYYENICLADKLFGAHLM